jgi:hypothetical protein
MVVRRDLDAHEPSSHSRDQGVVVVLPFVHGKELDIQKELLAHSHSDPIVLWFTATKDGHGPAALGFTRSLRREFVGWQVHVTLFDQIWPMEDYENLVLHQLFSMNVETETFVDADGVVCVPRVTHAIAPSIDSSFHEELPWIKRNHELIQHDEPAALESHVLVDIKAISAGESDLRAYIGVVRDSERLVVGITSHGVTNIVLASERAIADLPASFNDLTNGPPLLAAVAIVLGLGARALEAPLYKDKEIIVTHSDTVVGSSIIALLKHAGHRVHEVPSSATHHQLVGLRHVGAAFVFSGHSDPAALSGLEQTLSLQDSVFAWNDGCTGLLKTLRSQPWAIGDALRTVLPLLENDDCPRETYNMPIDIVKSAFHRAQLTVKNECSLFSAKKTYLLVGGIGSIGCQIALWMYQVSRHVDPSESMTADCSAQNGARRITMTSRSGRRSVFGRQDPAPQQTLLYLESRADLELSLLTADAADETAMRSVVSSIEGPIGGCMLLCLVLSDKSFVRHTKASYFSSFPPKVGGFETIEKVLSIPTLDWLVAFSSVTALLGNAGQTGYTT